MDTGIHQLIERCAQLIRDHKLTLAFAESATAGALAHAFAQAEKAGDFLRGGLICCDACLKEDILKIPKDIINEYTPESPEVTREMTVRLAGLIKATIMVGVTGLTKPGGSETPGKPVGTMFYCILFKGETVERKKIFTGTPDTIITCTIEQVAKTIINLLTLDPDSHATEQA